MKNTVEKWLFGFPKVQWLQYTGKVGKCTSYWCEVFSGFNTSKIIKIGQFLTELFEKLKGGRVFGTQCTLFTDSQAKVLFGSPLHTFAIAMQYKIQKVLFLDFANAKSLITSSKSTDRCMCASMQSRDRESNLSWPIVVLCGFLIHLSTVCTHWWCCSLLSYTLHRFATQQHYFLVFFKNIVMLCVVLCFNANVVNKFHDNEHCSCSDWAVCDIKRGRFAIHCFGIMLKIEGLEKHLGLGLISWQKSDVSVSSRSRGIAGRSCLGLVLDKNRMSRSRKLRSRLHSCPI